MIGEPNLLADMCRRQYNVCSTCLDDTRQVTAQSEVQFGSNNTKMESKKITNVIKNYLSQQMKITQKI